METNNETVEQVCESMRDSADRLSLSAPAISSALRCYSEDILSAHKREVKELRECLKEARRELCNGCRDKGFKCKKSEPCVTVLTIDTALKDSNT